MTNFQILQGSIQRVQSSLWMKNILQQTLRYGFYGACGSVGVILLSKFIYLSPIIWIIPLLTGIFFGLVINLVRKPSIRHTALFLDHTLFLQNRLATVLDYSGQTNPLTDSLLADTIRFRDKLQPSLAYKYLNMNYLFQFLLSGLVIIIIWFIPSGTSAAHGFNNILDKESRKLQNTAEDISQTNQLDEITRRLTNEMDRIAQAIESHLGGISPEQLIKQLEGLSREVKMYLTNKEKGENLFYQISHILGKQPKSGDVLADQNQTRQTLKELQEAINHGNITIDLLNQLKEILKSTQEVIVDDPTLTQPLQDALTALETSARSSAEAHSKPSVEPTSDNLARPLAKFFDNLARKHWKVLERIRTRIDLARKEITSGLIKYHPDVVASPEKPPVISYNGFSQANQNLVPLHSTPGGVDPSEIPIAPKIEPEKVAQIRELKKKREAALSKPSWPPEYNEIIRQYFK